MKKLLMAALLVAAPAIAHAQSCVPASQVTLAGTLRSSNGLPASNYAITMTPSQQGYIAGCGVNLQTVNACATSTDGSVVGLGNPTTASINTTSGGGSLPAGTYYTEYAWVDGSGHVTLASPETRSILSTQGSLVVNPPSSGVPSGSASMQVYIGTTSGGETLQGTATPATASYTQSTALTSGSALPATNTTLCQVTANDAVWPVGTGYVVTMTDSAGNPIPGYPMQWQLMGAGSTINLSNGLPYYHGVVYYPVPVLTAPTNHGVQSITGPLSLSGYNLLNAGKIGVGTSTPGYSIDVTNGLINSDSGYLVNGNGGTTGQCLASDGSQLDTFVNCITSLPTLYYQTIQSNGTAQTQRSALNFSSAFTVSDSASPSTTSVDLATTGVTAGSYSGANITVNAKGQITAASNGALSGTLQSASATSGCTTGSSSYSVCTMSVTWPTAFSDTNYQVTCSGIDPTDTGNPTSGRAVQNGITSKTTTGVTVQFATVGSNAISYTGMDCIAHHN